MKIYMFPISDPDKSVVKNPYMDNLIKTIEQQGCVVVNKDKISKYGVFDLLLYMNKVDTYYLNWIENLPDRRFGWIQTILFYLIFFILKLFGKKIIWMMHNKISHSKKGLLIKIITNYLLINYSDYVLTHSLEGIAFGKTLLNSDKSIYFAHHPIENNIDKVKDDIKEIDILIWGAISPYKGIDTFLEYVQTNPELKKLSIHIVGKITGEGLEERLKAYRSDKVVIDNNFISTEELELLFSKSKVILFTYAGYSTLSSAALMDSLSYGKHIIGPDVGVFRDLQKEGLVDTFVDFNMLNKTLENLLKNKNVDKNKLTQFINKNSWEELGSWFCHILRYKKS